MALRFVPEMPRENFQNLFVLTTSQDGRKVLPQRITPCIADVHRYKNILLLYYRVPQKTVKFVEVVPKTEGSATICAYQIAPLRSIKFQTTDFSIFWARIIVIF